MRYVTHLCCNMNYVCQDQFCTGNVGVKYTSYDHLVDAMVASGKCYRGMARSAGGLLLLGGMNSSQVVSIHTVCDGVVW